MRNRRRPSTIAKDPLELFDRMASQYGKASGPMRMMPEAHRFSGDVEAMIRARRAVHESIDVRMDAIAASARNISNGVRRLTDDGTISLVTADENGEDCGFMRWLIAEEVRPTEHGLVEPRGIELAVLAWGPYPEGNMHDSGVHGHPNIGMGRVKSGGRVFDLGGIVYDVIDGEVRMDEWSYKQGSNGKETFVKRCQDKLYVPGGEPLKVRGSYMAARGMRCADTEAGGALLPHDVRPMPNLVARAEGRPDVLSLHLYTANTRGGRTWSYEDVKNLSVVKCGDCECPNAVKASTVLGS